MSAHALTPVPRPASHHHKIIPGAILVALASCSALPAWADLGRWTPPNSIYEMGGEAIHMALLPGDGAPIHSRILWWQSSAIGVRLDVFDVQGRRVERLADRYFPAGRHAVEWRPARRGRSLGPGVYFARIEAGAFRARTTMTLTP